MIKVSTVKLTNEGIDIEGHEPSDYLQIDDDLVTVSEDVSFRLHACLVTNGALVTGSVRTVLECTCVRCLGKFPIEISSSDVCHFFENPLPSELDLTDNLREDILIIFPQNTVCSEDCKGMCLKCGQDLNQGVCQCSSGGESSDSIWGALDKLKC